MFVLLPLEDAMLDVTLSVASGKCASSLCFASCLPPARARYPRLAGQRQRERPSADRGLHCVQVGLPPHVAPADRLRNNRSEYDRKVKQQARERIPK